MPAVLSLIVILVVLYCLWLFTKAASPYQLGRVLGGLTFLLFAGGLLFLTLTGRLPLALLALIVVWPLAAMYFERRKKMAMIRYQKNSNADAQKKDQDSHDVDQNS
jgi:multisubunit Na+/H+ antiporter MnhG subunit